MRKIRAALLAGLMILTSASLSFGAAGDWSSLENRKVETTLQETAAFLLEKNPNPVIGSVGGEWLIIGLATSGASVPSGYFDAYYKRVENQLKESQGILTKNKYTEYSRLILALTALGRDVTRVGGYNLLEKLADFNNVIKQGINGPVYALIALDSHDYEIPKMPAAALQSTRQLFVDYILAQEITDGAGVQGGFSLAEGGAPDPDVTGMALQALSNYRDQPRVRQAIDRSLQVLKTLEREDGTYVSWGTETSESIVQVIVAKSALGLDSSKNVAGLLQYAASGGGFQHTLGEGVNLLATEQCLYALSAYKGRITEERGLFDMKYIPISGSQPAQIQVLLSGEALVFDQPPVIVSGRVLVPMRGVFEALGASVIWNEQAKEVTGTLGDRVVKLTIGSKQATLNGETETLDVPAQIVNGRTLVPVRFISQSLGIGVEWDGATKTVLLSR